MSASQFTDKQIMGLAGSGTGGGAAGGGGGGELFDLMNPQEERHGGGSMLKTGGILPSYDFQLTRAVGSSSSAVNSSGGANFDGGRRHSWGSADSKIASASLKYSNILDPHEPPKTSHEIERGAYDVATVAEIDRTVKKYADNLLHTMEGVSARLSQLESRTRHLESSVYGLKDTIENNNGSTDGKLRHLENILREVQMGIQVLRDKQEIAEAQLQLAKLQQSSSKADHYQLPPEPSTASAGQPDPQTQQRQPAPPPSYPPPPVAAASPQPPPPPAPNASPPPPPTQQNPPQFPAQVPQPQPTSVPSLPQESAYFPPLPQQMQPQHHSQPQPQSQSPSQPQHYQLPPYSQQMPPPQSLNPSAQLQPPPIPHHPEESALYMPPPPVPPSQTCPPSIRQPASLSQPLPASGPPQYYGSCQMSFPPSYAPPPPGPSFSDSYRYSGSPSHYSSTMKQSAFPSSPPSSGGGGSSNSGNYSRLPTAKILPQAVPTGPSSGGGRLPIDDVVDKVATMGFSREQVRATVRKLTENGQSVDLNVVLDKLMNDGGEMIQPQKGWFGR